MMKHFLFTLLFAFLTVGTFAQVPPKPADKAIVYDYANMLTPEDKVSIELMGLKLQSKYASKLVFVSVETKGDMKSVEFIRAIYSGWEFSNDVKGNYGLIVVCKKQIMASANGGFLAKCDSALTMKIQDSFQELMDKTTLLPFENTEDQNPLKGSTALKDSYMFFANAIIALHQDENDIKPQATDSTTKAVTEAVAPTVHQSHEQPSPTAGTPMAPPSPTAETAMAPPSPTAGTPMASSNKTWIICGLFFVGIVGIYFLFKKSGRSRKLNSQKTSRRKEYDANDYRDDN